ncbi:hypothetical protein CEP54_014973 [Fusarium duplospermum]|uniref:Uncharacterized protein n=1 Tax=Fusarium duplospermum TaxID=1325734 RepID=A0A428NSB9_9HYPO|nr:hypothetical protein CEP54_014973 [Fusarium duplospermum]
MWEDAVSGLSTLASPPDAFPDQRPPSTSNEAGYTACDEIEWQLPALDNNGVEVCSDATSEAHQTTSVHSSVDGTANPLLPSLVQKLELGLNTGTNLTLSGNLGYDSKVRLSERFEAEDRSLGVDDGSGLYESDDYDFQTCRMASEQPSIGDETQTSSSCPNMGASPLSPQAVRSLETDYADQPLSNPFQTPDACSDDTNIAALTFQEDSEPREIALNRKITGSVQRKRDSGGIGRQSTDSNLVAPIASIGPISDNDHGIDSIIESIDNINQKDRPVKRKKHVSPGPRPHQKKQKLDRDEQVNLRAEIVIWTTEEQELTYKWDSRERLWFTNTDDPEIVKVNGEFLLSQGQDIRIKVRPNAVFMPVVIEWKGGDTFEGYDDVEEDRRLEVHYSSVTHMVLYGEGGEGMFYDDI